MIERTVDISTLIDRYAVVSSLESVEFDVNSKKGRRRCGTHSKVLAEILGLVEHRQ